MKKLVNDFIDLVFPNCCPGCGEPLVSGEEDLCSGCELDLPVFPVSETITDYFAGRLKLEEARAYLKFYHGGITQKLLHKVKYNGDKALGEFLGRMFIKHLKREDVFSDIDVIIPVPLHKSKLRRRGYNQSDILAKGMAEVLGVPVDTSSVKRIRKSETQTRKDRAERWQNVSGIFAVTNDDLQGKHVLLVDDVITTGATLEACGEVILTSGAASLSIGALAAAM